MALAMTNSGGVPWTAAYVDSIGDPTCDLRSNIAAEARAKIVYERLINCTDDRGVKDALQFLMTREISHQQSFEKALYSLQPNFPPGKLRGKEEFANVYFKLPEGLAIGVAYASSDPVAAAALATGIAIQDVAEGLVIALALTAAGYQRHLAVALGAASGLVEPVGALAGAAIVTASIGLLPWGLAFAAGAMLWVISHEIIPESHRQGHQSAVTAGLVIGFVLMMVLDTALA
jgi:hypothetical protein